MRESTIENVKAYSGDESYAFVSYSHDDRNLVHSIIYMLQGRGYRIWFDKEIAPASEFPLDISEHLQKSVCVIFLISDAFLHSEWCKKEMHLCLEYKKEFLLVFLEEDTRPPENYLDLLGFSQNEEYKKIIDGKNHMFWKGYQRKYEFYEELERWAAFGKVREAVNEEKTSPISKIIDNTSEPKRIDVVHALHFSDKLLFGRYPTGPKGKVEAILWRVIAVEKERILLLSEFLLDAKNFHKENVEVCWASCDLRKWLNKEFYDQAFNAEEKDLILTSQIGMRRNLLYGTDCGAEIEAAVFLLSVEELYLYFTENPESAYYQKNPFQKVGPKSFMQAKYTQYALKRTSYTNQKSGAGWWWLRTSGEDNTRATVVTSTPEVNMEGYFVKFPLDGPKPAGGVRPAIWIRR